MALILFYITNNPSVAKIAEMYGVDRIWIDLETLGKEERQKNMNSVKSNHCISDITIIKPLLTCAQVMVRINPWNEKSLNEVDAVIGAGADVIMLPMWKTKEEVQNFLNSVNKRARTSLLLETREAVDCIDEVLMLKFDEIHIGLNDLHLSYGKTFMFELLSDGTVEFLCNKFKENGIPFGFGGIAKLGDGLLPAQNIIMEHYRLGSTRVILSRSFCDTSSVKDINEVDQLFRVNMMLLREYEQSLEKVSNADFAANKIFIDTSVRKIVNTIKEGRKK
jgi:hypothetical protein